MADRPFKKATPDEFKAAHDLAISILLRRQGQRLPTLGQLLAEGTDAALVSQAFGLLHGMLLAGIDDECTRVGIPYQKMVATADQLGRDQIDRMRQMEAN